MSENNQSIVSFYNSYYQNEKRLRVYPVEFVVRSFLGKYPNLDLRDQSFVGKKVLDLGYGDGRNIPFLDDLGFKVYGVEISDEINDVVATRLKQLGYKAELKKGTNSCIPYKDQFFDSVLACHSCYYVSEGESFQDNIEAIARVLLPGGLFICSLPCRDSYILKDAIALPDNHFRIQNDPYKIRKNALFKAFSDEADIKQVFGDSFTDLRIGYCHDNFYGIEQKVWIVTCWKK